MFQLIIFFIIITIFIVYSKSTKKANLKEGKENKSENLSVNFHFTRRCNYECGFCFHTDKGEKEDLQLDQIVKAFNMLKEAGMNKINFAGGEPFLQPRLLGKMVKIAKKLGIYVSIISNGSLIKENWIKQYGEYVDILAVSIDSFDEKTNGMIGRKNKNGKGDHILNVFQINEWCKEYNIKFKINSVINKYNVNEDMNEQIKKLNPYRWKVFQVLAINQENQGKDSVRNVDRFLIDKKSFYNFIERHKERNPVAEDNDTMKTSYILLDEKLRFLDCTGGSKKPTRSILEIGVEEALKDSGFDRKKFEIRGGDFYLNENISSSICSDKNLEW